MSRFARFRLQFKIILFVIMFPKSGHGGSEETPNEMTISRSTRQRALKLCALGAYAALVAIAACSSDPSAPTTPRPPASAGSSSAGAATAGAATAGAATAGAATAGAATTAGAGGDPNAGAGAPTTAGAGGDMNAGAPGAGAPPQPNYATVTFSVDNILWVADSGGGAGGAGGAANAGAGGATAGAAGASGAAGAGGAAGPYCSQPGAKFGTLPYITTTSFIGSDYQPNGGGLQIGSTACTHYDAACGTENKNSGPCGQCSTWTYTPNATAATYAGVGYVRKFDGSYTAPQICMPTTAKAVTFYAKGALGGEQVTFTAQGATELPVTLTATWTKYSLPLTGTFNTDTGVEQGFYWKVVPYVK